MFTPLIICSLIYLPDVIIRLFSINPSEPFKTGAKVVAMAGVLFTIGSTLITKTFPWVRTKLDARSVSNCLGPEFPRASIRRAIRHYIKPYCQDLDPAGSEEPRLVFGVREKLFEALDKALTHPTEYNFIILLADSGMGKTSALINYYARHLRRWSRPFNLHMIPLGIPNADERIVSIKERKNAVLFLDALDEDTLAIVDHVQRLKDLLKATSDFDRVVISCRTQFFSKDEEIPKETGKIRVGVRAAGESAEYFFHKIYLSPFSDEQVHAYLKERYPIWHVKSRKKARAMVEKIPHLTARPMLLAHIDDLVVADREIQYSYELYEEMVEAWLKREQGFIKDTDDLRQFSERLAVNIYVLRAERESERIEKPDLLNLANEWRIPLDDWKLSGRSLLNRDAEGNFKFAHRSIMEYLFVKRFLAGDAECLKVSWTDQMIDFYLEIAQDRQSKGERAFSDRLIFEIGPLSDTAVVFTQRILRVIVKRILAVTPKKHVDRASKTETAMLALLIEYCLGFLGLPNKGLFYADIHETEDSVGILRRLKFEMYGTRIMEIGEDRFYHLARDSNLQIITTVPFGVPNQSVQITFMMPPVALDGERWMSLCRITDLSRAKRYEQFASLVAADDVKTIIAAAAEHIHLYEPTVSELLRAIKAQPKYAAHIDSTTFSSLLSDFHPALGISLADVVEEARRRAFRMDSVVVEFSDLIEALMSMYPPAGLVLRRILMAHYENLH